MTGEALIALGYGLGIAALAWSAGRTGGHMLPAAGGMALGGLAAVGGLTMLLGGAAGRGMALVAAVLAVLIFGWTLSQSILNDRAKGKTVGILAVSALVAAVLVLGGRAGP